MYNADTYNSSTYNATFTIAEPIIDSIQFESYSLQNQYVITSRINYDNLEEVEINQFRFTGRDGGGVLSRYYIGRTISLEGTISLPTATLLNIELDNFKKGLAKKEGFLYVTVNGHRRKIKATCQSVVFDREHYHISFAKFRVVFQTAEPFLYDEFPDGIELVDIDDSFSEEFQNLGTAPTLPKFIFVFKAGTTVSEVEIETTETVLTITTALTQDDVLIVDSEEKTVTLNGSEIDYTGVFPTFPTGSNTFDVNFTGSVEVDVNIQTKRNYL